MITIPHIVLPQQHLPSIRLVRNLTATERTLASPKNTTELLLAATDCRLLDAKSFVTSCHKHGIDRTIAVSHKRVVRAIRRRLGTLMAYGAFATTSAQANQPLEFDSSDALILSLPCAPCLTSLTFDSRPLEDKTVLYAGLRIISHFLCPFYFAGIDPPLYEESGFAFQLRELRDAGWLKGNSPTDSFGNWSLLEQTEFSFRYESSDTESVREHVEELLRLEQGLSGSWRTVVDKSLSKAGKAARPLPSSARLLKRLAKAGLDPELKAWALKLAQAIVISNLDVGGMELLRSLRTEWEEGYCDYAFGMAIMLEQYGAEEAEWCLNGVCESETPALRLRIRSENQLVNLAPALRLFQTGLAALHEVTELET